MRVIFLVIFFFMAASLPLHAQRAEIIRFPELETMMHKENDTLYIFNFWATWCRPCVAELPYFMAADSAFAHQPVKFIFISLDFADDLESKLNPFLKKRQYHANFYLLDEPDYNVWINKISEEWQGSIPATLFVQKQRNIYTFREQSFEEHELFELIENLLKQ